MKAKLNKCKKINEGNLHKRLCPIYLALAGIFPGISEAETVVDTRQVNGPTMGTSANGTPMVNISDPNQKGISLNKFDQFNVDKNGLIFNNSTQDGVTKIGGYAIKNARLQQEASAIISEVTGAKGSYINGTMEVFGKKSDVIIANQNGISVNGATTINANSLTLSTGKVQMQNDGSYKLSVDKGNVNIQGDGISTNGLSYFDIVSRGAQLEGEIVGNADIKVLTGLNDYDGATRQHTIRSNKDSGTPVVAIDGSELGSMYGGRIQLISTESGAGVNHRGSIIGSSDIDISADGNIVLAGMRSDKTVNIAGNNITVQKNNQGMGGIESQGDIALKALATASINQDILSHGGKIRIDATTLLQQAASLITENSSTTAVPSIELNIAGNYTLTGKLQALDAQGNIISGGVVTLKNGDFIVLVNGQSVPFSSVVSNAQLVSLAGNIAVNAASMDNQQGSVLAKKGTLQITLKDILTNSGYIEASGDIAIASGSMKNSGVLYTGSAQSIKVASLENAGRINAEKQLALKISQLTNSGIVNASAGTLDIDASELLTNTGTISAKQKAIIKTATLRNEGGSISSTEELAVNVSKELVNVKAGQLLADKAVTITGTNNATLKNSDNALIQGKSVAITGLSSLENKNDAGLVAKEKITFSDIGDVTNDGGIIQANSVDISNIDSLSNTTRGSIYATGDLTLNAIQTVRNENATLVSDGTLSISNVNNLNNADSAFIASNSSLLLKDISSIDNLRNSAIQSNGALQVENIQSLNNASDSILQSQTDLALKNVKHINNEGHVVAGQNVVIEDSDSLSNKGIIQSGLDLVLHNIRNLTNEGEQNALVALRNLTMEDITELTNAGGAVITANMSIILDAIGVLINQAGSTIQAIGDSLTINADSITNTGTSTNTDEYGNPIVSVIASFGGDAHISANNLVNSDSAAIATTAGNLTLNIKDALTNSQTASLTSANNLTLNMADANLDNLESAVIWANNIDLYTQKLTNSGSVGADTNLTLDLSSLDNNQGSLNAGNTLSLEIEDDLNLTSETSNIRAGEKLNFTTHGNFINDSGMEVIGDLNIKADKDFINNQSIITAGDMNITAANITNNTNTLLWTMGDMNLKARDGKFINYELGNILSVNDISIIAKEIWNKAGIISAENNIYLDAEQVKNESTYTGGNVNQTQYQHTTGIYKTVVKLATHVEWAVSIDIPTLNSDIALDKQAEIRAGKDIYINERDIYSTKGLRNEGGLIQSGQDIFVTGDIYNSPHYASYSLEEYLHMPLSIPAYINYHWKLVAEGGARWTFNTLYEFLDFAFGGGSASSQSGSEDYSGDMGFKALVDAAGNGPLLNKLMSQIFGETWITSDPGTLSSIWANVKNNDSLNSMMTYLTPLEKGEITAGRDFNHTGGKLDNGVANAGVVKNNATVKTVDVGDKQVDTLDPSYKISINTQKVDKLSMGISPLPAIKDMVNVPGMFEKSDTFNKAQNAKKNGTEFAPPSNHIIPVYETRPDMIDQSKYTGSEYFFEQVGYNPDQPVTVIGDNYFTSELIRREINSAVGSFFTIRDGLSGDALVQNLMENAGIESQNTELGLVIGEPLSEEQRAGLDHDIIWFINHNVDGVDTMIPMVYLSPKTLDQLESGEVNGGTATIHGGNSVTSDATEINNFNGAISAGKQGKDDNVNDTNMSSGLSIAGKGGMTSLTNLDNPTPEISNNGSDSSVVAQKTAMMDSGLSIAGKGGMTGLTNLDNPTPEVSNNGSDSSVVAQKTEMMNSGRSITDNGGMTVLAKPGSVTDDSHAKAVDEIFNSETIVKPTKRGSDSGNPASGSVNLNAKGDINNVSNGMNAGISARGGVSIKTTEGDISSSGAAIKAGEDINMSAEKGDITMTASMGRAENGKQVIHANDDGITAGGSINMTAKNITSNAADISAGKDIAMKATEGDVTFNDIHVIDANRTIHTDINGAASYVETDSKSVSATAVGSNVSAGGKLTIDAKKDVVMEGGTYNAKTGDIKAGDNLDIKTSQDVIWDETTTKSREFIATADANAFGQTAKASTGTNSGPSSETTEGDYTSAGSNSDLSNTGKRRPGRAPTNDTAGFKIGLETITETETNQSVLNKNASLKFGDSVSLNAGKTADIGGADINATNDIAITADKVATTKYEDEHKSEYKRSEFFAGISGEAHSSVIDSLDKAGNLIEKAQDGQSINAGTTIAQLAGDASNLAFNDLAGGSVTIGVSKKKTGTSSTATAENITNINGGKVTINSKNDTELNGVNMKATDKVEINAGGDVSMNAAKSTTSYETDGSQYNAGITANIGKGIKKGDISGGVSFNASGSKEHSSGDTESYTNTDISAGNNVTINSGGDTNMKGANITAATADINTGGDLNIESVQDTVRDDKNRSNWGASVGLGVASGGKKKGATIDISAHGGGGSEYHDSEKTAQQSGIKTTDELNVKTGGDLNMAGAHLVSDKGTGAVDVGGAINATDVKDHVEQDGAYGGGGAGISVAFNGTIKGGGVNMYADTVDEIHYNETQKTTINVNNTTSKNGVNGEVNTDAEHMSVVTKDKREAGNNISATIGIPGGKGKKGSYDIEQPTGAGARRPTTDMGNTPRPDTGTPVRPDSGTRPKPDVNPQPKPTPDTKPQPKPETPDVKPQPKPETPDVKPQPKPETPDVKPQPKPETPDVKPQPKPETPDVKPQPKPETPDVKPQPKPETPDVKPQPKPDSGDTTDSGNKKDPNAPVKKWPTPNTNYPTLSPGSATAKPGFDTPPTPTQKTWNGDKTNRVMPSSNTSGEVPTLSPGSATGKTGMDMPADPTPVNWNGNTSNNTQWQRLLPETQVDIYAAVTIQFRNDYLA